jgi:hypothetical protein
MKLLREADAWEIARANTQRGEAEAQAQANSGSVRQARRDHNRRLAEALVSGWSALEMRERMDKTLADSLDGKNEGTFDPGDPRYHAPVADRERSIGGSEAAAATHRARKERKRKEAQFVSVQFNGRKK